MFKIIDYNIANSTSAYICSIVYEIYVYNMLNNIRPPCFHNSYKLWVNLYLLSYSKFCYLYLVFLIPILRKNIIWQKTLLVFVNFTYDKTLKSN